MNAGRTWNFYFGLKTFALALCCLLDQVHDADGQEKYRELTFLGIANSRQIFSTQLEQEGGRQLLLVTSEQGKQYAEHKILPPLLIWLIPLDSSPLMMKGAHVLARLSRVYETDDQFAGIVHQGKLFCAYMVMYDSGLHCSMNVLLLKGGTAMEVERPNQEYSLAPAPPTLFKIKYKENIDSLEENFIPEPVAFYVAKDDVIHFLCRKHREPYELYDVATTDMGKTWQMAKKLRGLDLHIEKVKSQQNGGGAKKAASTERSTDKKGDLGDPVPNEKEK